MDGDGNHGTPVSPDLWLFHYEAPQQKRIEGGVTLFTKGIAKIGGRRKGTANKLTSTLREAVLLAYRNIGGHEACSQWVADNQTDFYRIAACLIPTEVKNSDNEEITVIRNYSGRFLTG